MDIAGPGNLPYSVGGFIAVWRTERDMDFCPLIAVFGSAEPQALDTNFKFSWKDEERLQGPTIDQLVQLANTAFPDAEAFTFLFQDILVIELPEMDEDEFVEKLSRLPMYYQAFPWSVEWHNGPIVSGDATTTREKPVLSVVIPLKFTEWEEPAKKLLKQNEISTNDQFVVNSYPTGKQHATAVSFRAVVKKGSQGCSQDSHTDQATDASTVVLKQGIYATHSTQMAKEPLVEGSLPSRSHSVKEPTASEEEVLARGEVAGRLRFVIPEFEDSVRGLLCYADSLDPLIEEGLTTVCLWSRA